MKPSKFLLFITVFLLSISSITIAATRGKYRYHTSYRTFDSGFSSLYSYDERIITTSTVRCNSYTCYEDFGPGQEVYIEEYIIRDGSYAGVTRVEVYSDRNYSRRIATYHTRNRRVIHRSYHRSHHPYYGRPYYYNQSYYGPHYFVQIDEITAEYILAFEMFALGVDVLSTCGNDDACAVIGAASVSLASASAADAFSKATKESELAASIAKSSRNDKNTATSDL